ncbi:unnamed protein product [Prorocentrum cordatum]|uniref:Alpha-ketoglutarate-dependent dioxygenase AlkB-like domain-containing protein n=1 Tax=Prorocentrum cordatum TaxID=2364126 RepID=A0ABN9SWF9_9DINO|nr:unnamed protein product [Polarella glacialis]
MPPPTGGRVQGRAPPLRKLTALRKAFPSACYPLLSQVVAESRAMGLGMEETLALFAERWERLGRASPPHAPSSAAAGRLPAWPRAPAAGPRGPGAPAGAPRHRRWAPPAPGLAADAEPQRLQDGMALFPGLLTAAAQQWLADLFFSVGDCGARGGFGCFEWRPKGPPWLNYGHRAQYVEELPELPPAFQVLHRQLQAEVQRSGLCGAAPASVAVFNYYGGRSRGMGWHADADTDPPQASREEAQGSAVVSLSATSTFHYRALSGEERGVCLRSGDVLVFGGPSRQVEHCVAGIRSDSRQGWLRMPPGRLNITFRMW